MKKMRLKAFTMAEAILVMTILGIIATIMITTLKPAQFKDKGLEIMARKVLSEIDTAVTQILINDTADGDLRHTIDPDNPGVPYVFSENAKIDATIKLLKKYLTATRQEVSNDSFCKSGNATAFYLKDGACIGIWPISSTRSIYSNFPGENSTIQMSIGHYDDTEVSISYLAMTAFFIDTNGDKEPNTIFKDRFAIPVGVYGIKYDSGD